MLALIDGVCQGRSAALGAERTADCTCDRPYSPGSRPLYDLYTELTALRHHRDEEARRVRARARPTEDLVGISCLSAPALHHLLVRAVKRSVT